MRGLICTKSLISIGAHSTLLRVGMEPFQEEEKTLVKFVLNKGVPVNIQDEIHGSVLHYVIYISPLEADYDFNIWKSLCKFLLERGADINCPIGKSGNPLQCMIHRAMYHGPREYITHKTLEKVLEFFLQCGADLNAPSEASGTTFDFLDKLAVELATEKGREEDFYKGRRRNLKICTKVLLQSTFKGIEEDLEETNIN